MAAHPAAGHTVPCSLLGALRRPDGGPAARSGGVFVFTGGVWCPGSAGSVALGTEEGRDSGFSGNGLIRCVRGARVVSWRGFSGGNSGMWLTMWYDPGGHGGLGTRVAGRRGWREPPGIRNGEKGGSRVVQKRVTMIAPATPTVVSRADVRRRCFGAGPLRNDHCSLRRDRRRR